MEQEQKKEQNEQLRRMFLELGYTENEREIIRNTFFNKDLLIAFRKFLWQMPLSVIDLSLIETNIKNKKEVINILRKALLPSLRALDTFELMKDMWLVDFEHMMPNQSILILKTRKLAMDYIKQQISMLENGKENEIRFDDLSKIKGKKDVKAHIDMATRNMIARHTQTELTNLFILSIPKETPEQTEERLQKDSSK